MKELDLRELTLVQGAGTPPSGGSGNDPGPGRENPIVKAPVKPVPFTLPE